MASEIIHVCRAVVPKCYALMWSYGEICVGSNCCGRFNKDKTAIWKARLHYHRELLKENKEKLKLPKDSDFWMESDGGKLQRENIKLNIEWNRRRIGHCRERIKHFRAESSPTLK